MLYICIVFIQKLKKIIIMSQQLTVKSIFEKDSVKSKVEAMIGKKASGFITSVLQVATNNKLLANADPMSIYNAAMIAATLDLPVNPNLGFSYIVPYGKDAQFQIGWKGYVQLAQRTGQYQRINVTRVYENQFKSFNALTEELEADFSKNPEGAVVGYAAYFKLNNGFEKTVYWTKKQCEEHGRRFSKTFNNGPWKSDFDSMAMKTVLKSALSKWGVLSIEMQTAIKTDQAVIKDEKGEQVEYTDNTDYEIVEELPEMNSLDFEAAASEIKAGNTTLAEIETLYKMTEQQYNDLSKI
jgi:recombination protein RecT